MKPKKIILIPTFDEIDRKWLVNNFIERKCKYVTDLYTAKDFWGEEVIIVITGVGCRRTKDALESLKRNGYFDNRKIDIFLLGSAGSLTFKKGTPVIFPFKEYDNKIKCRNVGWLICVNKFITDIKKHTELCQPDVCFDMESKAVCEFIQGFDRDKFSTVTIAKIISDNGYSSVSEWREFCKSYIQPSMRRLVYRIIKFPI